jgi:hypothetical protein
MTGSVAELANAKALAGAKQRVDSLGSLGDEIKQDLATKDYAAADAAKLGKLQGDLSRAQAETTAEIGAREDLQSAYDASTFANKDADPEVKAKQKALAQVRAANKPVMHGKDNLVNTVCQPCLQKDLDKIHDCNTPYYVKYGSSGGPTYKDCHEHTLENYQGWDALIHDNIKTPSEKNVLSAMSANEGDFDSVQAYDSEVVTAGAMQKTVNPQGLGELPTQLRQFSNDPATSGVFDRVMGSKGYSIKSTVTTAANGVKTYSNDTLYFTDPTKAGATPITGSALDSLIQNNPDRQAELLGPFRELGRTPEFQRKQVLDFNDRLVGAVGKKPTGYNYPISDYVSSESGSALVLDQDVNRPGYVKSDFGSALDSFYADNPAAPKNPTLWTAAQRAQYEPDIVDNYSSVRRGTDMAGRAAKLAAAGLSDDPGSLTFPTGP